MKNTAKKVLSLVLAFCLLAALTTVAFADGKKFEKYLMIGDSVSIYCGTPASKAYTTVYLNPSYILSGTYSDRLYHDPDLGISSVCSCVHTGWRVQEALYALGGPNYTSDYILAYGGDTVSRMQKYSPIYAQAMKDADLISINLGSNNLMQALVYGLYTAFEKDGIAFSGSALDRQVLDCLERLKADHNDTEALVTLLNALETTERGIVLLKNALKLMPEAIKGFEKSWNEMMELIYTANPDASVLVLGLYNPIDDLVKYTAENSLSLGSALQPLTDAVAWMLKEAAEPLVNAMNSYLRSGNRFAQKYVFVDVSDVDLTGSKDGVHLGEVGQQYFYTQMKSAIVTHFVPESVPATKTSSAGLLGRLFALLLK